MRLEELVRTLEAEVHRLRAENSRLEQLEDENEELLQQVWVYRERLIEEVKESDTAILRTSEERRAWLHGLFDEALREMLAEEIERRESAEAENSRLVEELRVVREALEFYSKESNYDTDYWHEERSEAEWDEGELARAALSQSETPKGYKENLLECPKCLQAALREKCRGAWDWFYHCKSCGWYVWTGKKRNFSEALKGEE